MRNEFLDESKTTVSDDPRRIPAVPIHKGPNTTTVLRGGRIIDGTGKPAFLGHIILKRNKIKKILPENEMKWSAKAKIIDCTGKTIIPGLIDLHVHLTYPLDNGDITKSQDIADCTLRALDRMRLYIESGITSVRDVGSVGKVPFRLKEWSANNKILGPRIFAAGCFITATGGHAAEDLDTNSPLHGGIIEREGPDQWRTAVREQFKKGADLIKTGSHFSKEEIKAAIEEAHALGIKITSDAERHYIQWAVEAGIDMIEHPLPRSDETIRLMAEKGVESIPTLVAYDIIFDSMGGYYNSTSRRFTFSKKHNILLCKKMKEAGIKMGIGTDLVLQLYLAYADFYYRELLNFQKLGYTNLEILSLATKVNAEILDMEDKIGTITKGKLADLVILDGNPDENLEDIKNVNSVFRDGYLVIKHGENVNPRRPQLTYVDMQSQLQASNR
jgi:imidazolonepropionase-like amidohydrolase